MVMMIRVIGLSLLVLVCGCAVKTPSIVTEGRLVTQAQLKQEVATVKAKLDTDEAKLKIEIAALNEKISAANADIEDQYARRGQIFDTIVGVTTAFVPPPYGSFVTVGLGIAGVAFGFVKRRETSTAVAAVDTIVKAVKATGATATATAVSSAVAPSGVSALIDERVKATGSDVL